MKAVSSLFSPPLARLAEQMAKVGLAVNKLASASRPG
jgi:hypothetical protein